jgi:hypothetical protein
VEKGCEKFILIMIFQSSWQLYIDKIRMLMDMSQVAAEDNIQWSMDIHHDPELPSGYY